MRNPGKVLHTMQREVNTNQRIYFDFYRWDITCWDLAGLLFVHKLRYCYTVKTYEGLNFVQVENYSIINAMLVLPILYTFVSLCLHSNGGYLISGSTSGCIYAWDLQNASTKDEFNESLQSVLQFQGHKNAVNGCRYASHFVHAVIWEHICSKICMHALLFVKYTSGISPCRNFLIKNSGKHTLVRFITCVRP